MCVSRTTSAMWGPIPEELNPRVGRVCQLLGIILFSVRTWIRTRPPHRPWQEGTPRRRHLHRSEPADASGSKLVGTPVELFPKTHDTIHMCGHRAIHALRAYQLSKIVVGDIDHHLPSLSLQVHHTLDCEKHDYAAWPPCCLSLVSPSFKNRDRRWANTSIYLQRDLLNNRRSNRYQELQKMEYVD